MSDTELADLFRDIERGVYPDADGTVRVLRQPPDGYAAVLAFTAHIVIAADIEPEWAVERLPPGDLSEPLNPPFLAALCQRLDRRMNCLDMVTYAPVLPGPPSVELTELAEIAGGGGSGRRRERGCGGRPPQATLAEIAGGGGSGRRRERGCGGRPPQATLADASHPRVRRARAYRSDVRVWATDGGVLVLGRGLAGRLEVAFEVDPDRQGRGLGRALARSARQLAGTLAPDRAGVWAQVSPGNAASVRTLLAAGYLPIGSEALLVRHRSAGG